jgi:RNA polymerase sigma-70 factor (ECF subfamily)
MSTSVTEALPQTTFGADPRSAAAPSDAATLDFCALYATWFRVVRRWVTALGGRGTDADDVTQEVFLVVQRKLADFDGTNLAGWLYLITRRAVRDHRRRSWFRRIVTGCDELVTDQIHDPSQDTAELLERKQDQLRFYRIVDRMNKKWREAFLLFEVVGHSGEEIAALQGIPTATVRTHLLRARKEFLALVAREVEG